MAPAWCYENMAAYKKKDCRFHLRLDTAEDVSAHGGQLLIDCLAKRFGVWNHLAKIEGIDPRKRQASGFSPISLMSQIMLVFASGATSLADMERLGQDQVLVELVGLAKGADQSSLGEWLRAQSSQSVEAVMTVNRDFVAEVLKKAKPGRVLDGGRPTVFFGDMEIEVEGEKFEGARINHEGNRALSFQMIWVGPFVGDAILDVAADSSGHMGELLAANRRLWVKKQAHFYANSASSAANYLKEIDENGFGSWSVSCNKRVEKLETLAAGLPETQWSMDPVSEDNAQEGYAWVKHTSGDAQRSHRVAVVRRKAAGEMFWRYGFVVGADARPEGRDASARSVIRRHQLKGASEHGFSYLLNDLDLRHPPCEELAANQMFYALGVLAYNLMIAFRVLELPDYAQGWRAKTIIRNMLVVPVKVSTHARRRLATVCVPAGWMRLWRVFLEEHGPKRTHGGARLRVEESGF